MKRLVIPHVELELGDVKGVSEAIGSLRGGLAIDNLPWAKEYSYKPDVHFMAFYTDSGIILKYSVIEKSIRAVYGGDNEPVYEDSCVEFFFSPGDDKNYFNFEFNCIGTLLAQYGSSRQERNFIDTELLESVKRYSTLGEEVFPERKWETGKEEADVSKDSQPPRIDGFEWELTVTIPFSLIFSVSNFDGGIEALRKIGGRGNFYKCGDKLETPHYLSWSMINTPHPDFHRPEFFGEIVFV